MEPHAGQSVRVGQSANGVLTYHVDLPPENLPPVLRRDLEAAWDAARSAAARQAWGVARLFCFRRDDGSATELALADPDACCWAGAVDGTVGMGNSYGLSLCLRLLALVDVMARARWTTTFFTLHRDGASIHPALLNAAATMRLTGEARFDAAELQTRVAPLRLPSGARS